MVSEATDKVTGEKIAVLVDHTSTKGSRKDMDKQWHYVPCAVLFGKVKNSITACNLQRFLVPFYFARIPERPITQEARQGARKTGSLMPCRCCLDSG
ncbi:putative rhoptry protein ROP7 [Toxoplasma gondii ARI]|uniref:Putative rhoptry protein ROP7 n=1 Tax=Toxoplasma gondii ARI TaxID=1074872 RepID=A0A139XJT7_TOXGO|nr:putative rhoptry protein ROP7 [Toxoplasma gondii ARI]